MKTHDFSNVSLLAVDLFRMFEALDKDDFGYDIFNTCVVSPRPILSLSNSEGMIHNVEIPFTFGELEMISSRIIPEFFGVTPSHLDALVLRMCVSLELNEPFPIDYVI